MLASPHTLNMAEVASFAQPTPFADPVRVFNPVETDDESDNEESIPQASIPDQAQRHARSVVPRFAPPRATSRYFLEGCPWFTGLNRKCQTPLQPLFKTRNQFCTTPSELQWTAITSPTLTMTQIASLRVQVGEDPVWNEFESCSVTFPKVSQVKGSAGRRSGSSGGHHAWPRKEGSGESRRSGCFSSDSVQSSRDEKSPKILGRSIQICHPICFGEGQRGQKGA